MNEPMNETISDDRLVSIVRTEMDSSLFDDADRISKPIDYYFGDLPGVKECASPGSGFTSMDVHDGVEATVAEIMPAFRNNLAEFESQGEADEEQAKTESDICNYLLMEQYNGHVILATALKDCLLHRNGYARVYWDNRHEVGYENYEEIPEQAIAQVMQPRSEGEKVEIVAQEQVEPPPEVVQQHQMAMQQYQQQSQQHQGMMVQQAGALVMGGAPGMVPPPPQEPQPIPAFYDIELRRTYVVSSPVIDSVSPEFMMVNADHDEVDLDTSRFNGMRMMVTRSYLIEMGYDPDLVADLSTISTEDLQYIRNNSDYGQGSAHESTEVVEVDIVYINVDRDGDDIAELRRVVISGETLLDDAPWDATEMIAGASCIFPHRHEGVSLYDMLKPIQDSNTALIRSTIDHTARLSAGRVEVDDSAVNLDDLLTSVQGGVVRSKRPGSVMPLNLPDISQGTFSTLDILSKARRDRGGAAIDSASQTVQIGGDSAHGIERIMSNIELTNAEVGRVFSETFVRGLYLRLHTLLRKFHQGEISAKIDGQWVTTRPSEWMERGRVSINIGVSQGERQRKASALQGVMQIQQQMMEMGMPTTTPEKIYQASVDQAELLGINNAEAYFVDPQSEEGQQLAQQNAEAAQKAEAEAQQDKQFQFQLQAQTAQAQVKVADAEMAKAQVSAQNNQLKNEIDQLKQQLAEAEAASETGIEIEKMNRDTALKLLELEQKAQKDLNVEYLDNKEVA